MRASSPTEALTGLPAGAGGSGLAGSERSYRESATAAAAPATDGALSESVPLSSAAEKAALDGGRCCAARAMVR